MQLMLQVSILLFQCITCFVALFHELCELDKNVYIVPNGSWTCTWFIPLYCSIGFVLFSNKVLGVVIFVCRLMLFFLLFVRFMIQCDSQGSSCFIWYHGPCVKISKKKGRQMEITNTPFICYNCHWANLTLIHPKNL